MARPLRITFPGAFYHVTSRGNERKDVFKSIRIGGGQNEFEIGFSNRKRFSAASGGCNDLEFGGVQMKNLIAK